MRRYISVLIVLVAAVAVPVASASSVLSTSNEKFVSLGVNAKGEALVKYKDADGTEHETLAWGAQNALPPKPGGRQVDFKYDYSGGYTLFKDDLAKGNKKLRADQASFKKAQAAANKAGKKYSPDVTKYSNAIKADYAALAKLRKQAVDYDKTFSCKKYTGPKLAFMVGACTAPDGTYWAVQQWQRQLPDYGVKPDARQSANELHLAHWTGELPQLTVETDWAYHKWDHLFGTYTYGGNAIYGFKATAAGQPLDTFGRNVYVDSFGSDYPGGAGTWMRVNSFLTHTGTGVFCYVVSPHPTPTSPTGAGAKYRLTILGPGVTPDVSAEVSAPGAYNQTVDEGQNQKISALGDKLCKPN